MLIASYDCMLIMLTCLNWEVCSHQALVLISVDLLSITHIQHRIDKNHNTLTVYTVGTSIPQQKVFTQIPQSKLLTNIPQNNSPQHDCKIIVESLFIAHFVFLACHNPSLTKWVPHHSRITLVNLNSFHIKTIHIWVS